MIIMALNCEVRRCIDTEYFGTKGTLCNTVLVCETSSCGTLPTSSVECMQSTTTPFLKILVGGHVTCKYKREAITHQACHR